ncbi:MAG: hypothetical protein ACMG55_09700 [Microcoleus sp.]
MAKSDRKTIDKVFVLLGAAMVAVLLVIGGLAWYGYDFATTNVRTELSAQKVFFPPKGSAGLDPKEFPDLQQYAGKQVNDGPTAKAYANGFIGRHLEKVAGGLTYSEVSALSMKDPTNAKLQQQKQVLFQGETLRGLLLGDGYAYWTFGQIAQYAAIAAFVGAGVMAVLVLLGLRHLMRKK